MRLLGDQNPSDGDVIRESLRDGERFGVLYDRYSEPLYRYAYRRLGSEFADDAVAETFLAAFRRRGSYDLARPDARPWLFGILSREISMRHRAEDARYRALARAQMSEVSESFADDVVAAVAAQGVGATIVGALRQLPGGDRDVVLLIAWNGFSYGEVAEALGIKLGTVRSRLHRARRRLRAALGDDNPIDLIEVTG